MSGGVAAGPRSPWRAEDRMRLRTSCLIALLVAACAAEVTGCGGSSGGGGGGVVAPAGTGSRYWYVNDAFGNPYKTHSSSEASSAQQVLALVNQERANNGGLPPLTLDTAAERAAKVHAEDMEGRGFFSHTTPEGWSPGDRLQMTGATGYSGWGENIAVGQLTAQDVMTAWMGSSGHRANILSATHTHLGVGVAERTGGGPYWVQVFLRRP